MIRKLWLFSKFMTSNNGVLLITIHILSNIPKRHQSVKLGQFLAYNMRNNCLEKSYTTCGGETSPRPFSTNSKLSISLDWPSEHLCSFFLMYVHRGRSRTAATSKVELFVITVNGFQPLTIIINSSTLDVAAVLDLVQVKNIFGNSRQKVRKSRYQSFLDLSFLMLYSIYSWCYTRYYTVTKMLIVDTRRISLYILE